ncbi:hypothetical protein ACJRO7_023677 [Eucalyptus globulus]|uniref:Uncharacterized protein n=1 Tax=Eucalyptus globulus TaxID=34317 RepID=A0ABD3K9L3_EUCGL
MHSPIQSLRFVARLLRSALQTAKSRHCRVPELEKVEETAGDDPPPPLAAPRRPDRMNQGKRAAMITRSNLAEQLREYQVRSKHNWATVSFFSSTSAASSSRVDVVVFVIWELVILAFLVFSAVSLYFRHIRFAFILVCFTVLLLLCMKIAKKIKSARKKKRRMLLPLSM